MKLYTFTHKGLAPVAKGIQAQHALARMFVKYNDSKEIAKNVMLYDWAEDYETIVSLDGGTSTNLLDLINFLQDSPYPWAHFVEDESFEFMTTAVVMVLPEKIYEMARLIRTKQIEIKDDFLQFLIKGQDETIALAEKIKAYGSLTQFDTELINKITYARTAQ